MKNYSIKPGSAFVFSKKKYSAIFLFFATIFMISCRKDINENFNGATITDSAAVSASAIGNTYYLSPTGNDNNPGTLSAPFFTLNKAWTVVAAGDIVYMRGGTYTYTSQQYLTGKNGTVGNTIKIFAYTGESPVITRGGSFDKSAGYYRGMVFLTANYVHINGIRFTGMYTDDNQVDDGLLVYDVNNCTFERLELDNNVHGMYMQNVSTGNLILNCDFHDNYSNYNGSNGGNSDGLALAYMLTNGTTNTIRGCRAWNNGDDGFDTFEDLGYVLIENCWSWHNGYQYGTGTAAGNGVGFKLGSDFTAPQANVLKRRVQFCVAWDNRDAGIHINEAEYKTEIYNCTFYNNAVYNTNFHWTNRNHLFKNVISFTGDTYISANTTSTTSSYGASDAVDQPTGWTNNVSNTDFVSVTPTGVAGARQTDGSLPVLSFLHLVTGSDLINTGTNVGLPYNSISPDRGAFESGGTAVVINQPPVANAGTDKNITIPVNSISLTGSGTDPDGTITTYQWSFRSGPNTPVLAGASTTTLAASSLVAGTYVFRLTVTDNNGLTAFDEVNVVVSTTTPLPNQPPIANAGADKNITLPVNSVSIAGSGSDPDGTIASYSWTFRTGPNTPVLAGVSTTTLAASSLIAGTYVLRLTVTDNKGLTAFDEVNVSVAVSTTTNQAPVANAGADKTITLPVNSISLTGSGTDPDGTITKYQWSFRSGPNTPVLAGASTTTLAASNLIAGTYTFRLTVTDNKGLTAFDQVKVVVKPNTSTNLINTSQVVQNAGFSYYVVQNFGVLPDISSNPTISTLRIFENGIELKPPHSIHSDIETLGKGRFSHWGDGAFIALYFSASDNTNPKTNGRTYTYTIQ